MKLLTYVVAFLACAATVHTQTQTTKAQWAMGETAAVAGTFTYTLKDGATVLPFTGAVACLAAPTGGGSVCTAPLAPLASGTHTLVLTASNSFGSADSLPLSGTTPGKPSGFSITITITVP